MSRSDGGEGPDQKTRANGECQLFGDAGLVGSAASVTISPPRTVSRRSETSRLFTSAI